MKKLTFTLTMLVVAVVAIALEQNAGLPVTLFASGLVATLV